jgi:hypothetical protein
MRDLASRVRGHIQLTTDGFRVYVDAGEDAFAASVATTRCCRRSTAPTRWADDRRYSPPVVLSDRHIETTNARLSC